MVNRVLLVLVDGMRPESLALCEHPFAKEFIAGGAAALDALTVMPSVTLPCHMSLIHSVDPGRHGVTTNVYTPPVRPVPGLFEQLHGHHKACGFFYDWEELRDIGRPGSLAVSVLASGHELGYETTNRRLTDAAVKAMREEELDFTFLYLGLVDEIGHQKGWMGPEYLDAVRQSWDCIEQVVCALSEAYTVIVTADHGGHDRCHGTDSREDMCIPVLCRGAAFQPGASLTNVSIKDIAPTIAALLGVPAAKEWEGRSLV